MPSTVARDRARDRETRAVAMRVRGASYQEIAEAVGYYDKAGAQKAVTRALAAAASEQREDRAVLVQRELDLIDACIAGLAEKVGRGDVRAVEGTLRAIERRARLLGLDAPMRADVTVTDALTAEVQALADEIAGTA